MSDAIVFDKAKWHYEADNYPADLGPDGAFVHTGLFLGWVIDAGLYSEEFADDFADESRRFRRRKLTGPGVYRSADGVFADDMLSEDGRAFARAYFDFDAGEYLSDYDELLSSRLPSMYHVPDTWASYDAIKPRIDERYAVWQRDAGGP